jgi:hypothetical protein
MLHSKGLVLALPSSFRLVLKWLKVTNTLAYYRTKLKPAVNILWNRFLGNARLHSIGRLLALDASITTMVQVTESKHWRFEIGWILDIYFPIWSDLIHEYWWSDTKTVKYWEITIRNQIILMLFNPSWYKTIPDDTNNNLPNLGIFYKYIEP